MNTALPTKPFRPNRRSPLDRVMESTVTFLASFRQAKDSLEATQDNLDLLDNQIGDAEQELAVVRLGHGDKLLRAAKPEDLDRADEEVAASQRALDRLRTIRASVAKRLATLQANHDSKTLDERWADTEAKLAIRDKAILKAAATAAQLAKDAVAAQEAARAAYDAMPVPMVHGAPVPRDYFSLGQLIDQQLSLHSLGEIGTIKNSALWTLQQGQTLAQRLQASTDHWLSARHSHDQDPPEAA